MLLNVKNRYLTLTLFWYAKVFLLILSKVLNIQIRCYWKEFTMNCKVLKVILCFWIIIKCSKTHLTVFSFLIPCGISSNWNFLFSLISLIWTQKWKCATQNTANVRHFWVFISLVNTGIPFSFLELCGWKPLRKRYCTISCH